MISILAIQFVYEMEFNCSTSFRIAGMWAEMMTRTASLYTNTQKVYYCILESLIYFILCTIFVCWTIILLQCIEEQHPSFSFPSYNKVAGIPFLISSLYSLVRDMYEIYRKYIKGTLVTKHNIRSVWRSGFWTAFETLVWSCFHF